MWFFIVIVILLVLLILTSLLNTLLYFSLKLVTKHNYSEQELNIASLLSVILWIISYGVLIEIISKITKMNIIDTFISLIFNTNNMFQKLPNLIFPMVIILIITILLQSLVLLILNIDYIKIINNIKYKLNKNQNLDSIETSTIQIIEEKYKLSFVNSFATTLFIFSLMFFIGIILFCIGMSIAGKFI